LAVAFQFSITVWGGVLKTMSLAAFIFCKEGNMKIKDSTAKVIAGILIIIVSWFIWRPLGAFVTVIQTGYVARFIRTNQNLLFWSTPIVIFIGIMWGIIMGILIQVIIHFSIDWSIAKVFFNLLGLMAVGYVGYGLKNVPNYLMDKEHANLLTIQILGLVVYAIVSAIIVFVL
jgi:hypothetical protein